MWAELQQQISSHLGSDFQISKKTPVSGGCINQAWAISNGLHSFFVKTNSASQIDMFEAEFAALQELRKADAIRVPEPFLYGADTQQAFLVMEHVDLNGSVNASDMGEQLARMHRFTGNDYGWFRDNTIGATEQVNTPDNDWPRFWQQQRLGFQLQLARKNGISASTFDAGEELQHKLPLFFDNYTPEGSLLHGDLWGGNAGSDSQGNPVIYDPASYYGDRETDIAMTGLFGGFSQRFYDAYQANWPLDPGYSSRKTLYNLYHILNHYNLFGGSYSMQADTVIRQCLAELR